MQPAGVRVVKMRKWDEEWSLWPLGDVHIMNRGCHERLFDETLATIADDGRALWAGMGDLGDLISIHDKRFDPEAVDGEVTVKDIAKLGPTVKKRLLLKLMPVADKCIGMIRGNHEWSYSLRHEVSIVEDLVAELNDSLPTKAQRIPFMYYSGFRDLRFVCGNHERTFRVCMHHGAGYSATKGGKLNRLLRFMSYFACDIFLMGHVHAATDDVIVTVGVDEACQHLIHRTKVGVITGTFLRTYPEGPSGYAERKGYEPAVLGAPRIIIRPSDEKRPLKVESPW